ncbi:hypothetical protein HPB51_020693 [Rhipicephalus microplus]|uniref:PiggyBac transposable element-derived protein domain-containing protein n=1 Tax=Rhipicephalus microplus TaxID=6941 RepID=A0A9J6EU93_RHIMP|nr:hypothetical protein HPB51_020693 [Rhipicephalus microplus]
MGGVDRADQLLSFCRNELKTKKWYKRIIFHLLDLAIVNSWLLYCAVKDSEIERAKFKLQVTLGLRKSEKSHKAPLHDRTLTEHWLSNRASDIPTAISSAAKAPTTFTKEAQKPPFLEKWPTLPTRSTAKEPQQVAATPELPPVMNDLPKPDRDVISVLCSLIEAIRVILVDMKTPSARSALGLLDALRSVL